MSLDHFNGFHKGGKMSARRARRWLTGCFCLGILWLVSSQSVAEVKYKPGELLVKFKLDVAQHQIEALNASYGATILEHIDGLHIYRLKIPEAQTVSEMVARYRQEDAVASAGPHVIAQGAMSHMPKEVIAKFKPGTSQAEKQALIAAYGLTPLDSIEELGIYRLRTSGSLSAQQMVMLYGQETLIESAEPNHQVRGGDFFPNDTFFPTQWFLHNTGQTSGTPDADIDAVEGWQLTRGSSSIVVAVLDTGIESGHPEFQGRLVPGFDFVNDDDDPEADHPHGVSVTGILAANSDNNFAGAGVDHRVSIMPVKVLDAFNSGSFFGIAEGITFAANQGAHVINLRRIKAHTSLI